MLRASETNLEHWEKSFPPQCNRDMDILLRVQQRFTKTIKGLEYL